MKDERREEESRQEVLRVLDRMDREDELPQELRGVVAEVLRFVYTAEDEVAAEHRVEKA